MKMAYKYHNGNRNIILHSNISFHGKLLGAASVSGSPELHFDFPKIAGTQPYHYNDIVSIKSLIDKFRQDYPQAVNEEFMIGDSLTDFECSQLAHINFIARESGVGCRQ